MDKYSPAPWEHVTDNGMHGHYVCDAFGTTVCDLYYVQTSEITGKTVKHDHQPDEAVQNARLISAAPELLTSCLWLKAYAEVQVRKYPNADDTPNWQYLIAAIAKATGDAS